MSRKENDLRWERSDVTSCNCDEKTYRHVHCPCMSCNGRATNRGTELRHWKEANVLDLDISSNPPSYSMENDVISNNSSSNNSMETDDECASYSMDVDSETATVCGRPDYDMHDYSNVELSSKNDDPVKKLIMKAVLNALRIQKDSGLSINTFTDILDYGKRLLLESNTLNKEIFDPDVLATLWPKSWRDVQALLKEEGYSDAKEYFICFCNYESQHQNSSKSTIKYTGQYSIMNNKDELCKHCGKQGHITYYYLGLQNKVINWFRDPILRKKMLSHWMEREHWLGRDASWHLKKEVWDGERWRELQWFWDPNQTWLLPCCCKYCDIPISVDHLKNSKDGPVGGMKVVECPECLESFDHHLKTAVGSPFNIALIGHWDGWQTFSGSSSRNCGSMEVTIANLKKEDRNHTEEVYVLGFVPLTYVPKLPKTYDPFLEPLMKDICKGFIHGFDIGTSSLHDINKQEDFQSVRVLLLCWSGDHPGQCEIGKLLNQGTCPCRRCQLVGQHLAENDSNNHMYYGDNRSHYKHQWEPRKISDMRTDLYDVEAETRQSVRKKMSSSKGVTGISLLHKYLHPLYGFDILQDLTYDIFHTVCLNVVKNQTERLLDLNIVDKAQLSNEIKSFPWSTELKSGRLPRPVQNYSGSLGQWKAEGLQKFSFPMADCVLDNCLEDDKELEIQHLVSRLTEMHFNTGRYGWTDSMIEEHRKLSWRLNILVEETQGLKMCTISMHNLLHVHEDIMRFSSCDNYWCAVFERAVKGYIKRSSNCKGIEKTFAFAESRREFLKPHAQKKEEFGKIDCKLGIASSVNTAKVAIDTKCCTSTSLLLGAMDNISFLEEAERRQLADGLAQPLNTVSEVSYKSKKCFMANRAFGGTVFKSGEAVVVAIDQVEVVMKLTTFLSVKVEGHESYQHLAKGNIYPYYEESDEQTRHFWTGFVSVKETPMEEPTFCDVSAIQRKVILYKCVKGKSYTVVDYQRQKRQLPFHVVVPVYPEKGDMLLIQGEGVSDIWYGHACNVNYKDKAVDVYFFVEHSRKRNTYVRETFGNRARNVVPWASIIGLADGEWNSSYVQWHKH